MHRALLRAVIGILGCCAPLAADPMDAVVQASATVTEGTAAVTLTWVAGTSGDGYDIYRRDPAATSWGSPIASLAAGATTWTDATVAIGTAYEYQLVRFSLVGTTHAAISWGYVLSGVDAATQADYRGSVVLLVDTATYTPTNDTNLSSKIIRLQQDMVADGWNVIRHDVTRTDSVPSIKALITADYAAAPSDVKMVFLFGNVPVAYSGDLAFDGHAEHQGAWPADGFYADMDGIYTDSTVNDTSSGDPRIDNVPGDGKYDQSFLTGTTFLALGRVDLSDMWPGYSEPAVLKTYLDRDHAFRTRVWSAQQKAVAIDGFGDYAPAVQTALRSYPPLVGAANITRGGIVGSASNVSPTNWWPTMDDPALAGNPYLLAFQSGPGYSQGIINGQVASWDFTVNSATPMESHAVFCTFFGSFFGDWGYDVALLKAPLAGTGEGLACFWAGRPDWFMHRLGLGGNLGSVLQLSMAHSAEYQNQDAYPQAIQLSLMGDPTLRLHPLVPPGAVTRLEKHEHEHFVIVGEGVGHAIVGSDVREIRQHDVVYVAPWEPHQFVNRGTETFGFYCIVSSVRDFSQELDPQELARLLASPAGVYADPHGAPPPRARQPI